METYDLSKLTASDFRSCLNQSMEIHFSNEKAVLSEVIKVTELNSYSPLERGAFSVVFQTTGDITYRAQGIHRISHPVIKDLEVFLVPIGIDKAGMKYEAVFS